MKTNTPNSANPIEWAHLYLSRAITHLLKGNPDIAREYLQDTAKRIEWAIEDIDRRNGHVA